MEKIESSITSAGGHTGRRMAKDKLFKYVMVFGGLSVIIAISTIFFYLAGVVAPLFMPPHMDDLKPLAVPALVDQSTVHLGMEEQVEIGIRVANQGNVTFFSMLDGKPLLQERVSLPESVQVTSFSVGDLRKRVMAFGLADGRIVLLKDAYKVSFTQDLKDAKKDVRSIAPGLVYPLGTDPLVIDDSGQPLKRLAIQHDEDGTTAIGLTEDSRLLLAYFKSESDFIGESVTTKRAAIHELPKLEGQIDQILLEVRQRDLYVIHGGRFISHFDVQNKDEPKLLQTVAGVPEGEHVTAVTLLSGGFSLIVGTDKGRLAQWFQVRDVNNKNTLTRIREFKSMGATITLVAPEHARKGFVAADEKGAVNLYYATSERLLVERVTDGSPARLAAFSPRANAVLLETEKGEIRAAHIENEYPEISFGSLWGKVWYESYEKPDFRKCAALSSLPSRSWKRYPPSSWDSWPVCGWRPSSTTISPAR